MSRKKIVIPFTLKIKQASAFVGMMVLAQNIAMAQNDSLNNSLPAEEGALSPFAGQAMEIDIMDYLPPLSVLIDSALKNSPDIRYSDEIIEAAEYDIIIARKDWAKDVKLNGGYSYTEGFQYIQGVDLATVNDQASDAYNIGVSISIPLSTWYGRRERIKKAEARRDSEEARYEQVKRMVREEVIETYNKLLLTQRLLDITAEAKESTRIILEAAEEQYREGEITLDRLGQSTELKARYAREYEELRTEFSNTYTRLERLVGVPFSKFETVRRKL